MYTRVRLYVHSLTSKDGKFVVSKTSRIFLS